MSYEEADNLASNVGRGLRVLGQEPNKPLCIFADTRAEWMVSAQVTNHSTVSRHSDQSQHSSHSAVPRPASSNPSPS